jgi:hypothetical protein
MQYAVWNDMIGRKFFNPNNRDRRVYLHVSEALINALGEPFGVSLEDFVLAVTPKSQWGSPRNICQQAVSCSHNWRRAGLEYPPYIGYLAFFVLAAGLDGDFAPNAYYPRLRKLLGEPIFSGTYPHFPEIRPVWEDLQQWSSVERRGELGLFDAYVPGRFIHVGTPIAQVILTELERKNLPKIFAEAGLEPLSSPSLSYLRQCLSRYGTGQLRDRTLQALRLSPSSEEGALILSVTAEDLENWEGTVSEATEAGESLRTFHGTICLCLSVDEVKGTVRSSIRCKGKGEFSDATLTLVGIDRTFQCVDFGNGWSTALQIQGAGKDFDLSHLDWSGPIRMQHSASMQYKMPEAQVRILASGMNDGIRGYIEVQHLPENEKFLIAVSRTFTPAIEKWGRSSCDGFRMIHVTKGMPSDWNLYEADRARSDIGIKHLLPTVSFSDLTRIRIERGVRDAEGAYFSFALPEITLLRAPATAQFFLNNRLIPIKSGERQQLGPLSEDELVITMQVRDGQALIRQQTIYIHAAESSMPDVIDPWVDAFGLPATATMGVRVSGAQVVSKDCEDFDDWIVERAAVIIGHDDLEEENQEDLKLRAFADDSVEYARLLLSEWRAEISAGVETGFSSKLSSLSKGIALSEGALHYMRAVDSDDPRQYARAIKEFTTALTSEHPVVRAASSVLLLISLLRTDRPTGSVSIWPKLADQTIRTLKAQSRTIVRSDDQLQLSDITPMIQDIDLFCDANQTAVGDLK